MRSRRLSREVMRRLLKSALKLGRSKDTESSETSRALTNLSVLSAGPFLDGEQHGLVMNLGVAWMAQEAVHEGG